MATSLAVAAVVVAAAGALILLVGTGTATTDPKRIGKNRTIPAPGPLRPFLGNTLLVLSYAKKRHTHRLRELARSQCGPIYRYILFSFEMVMVAEASEVRRVLSTAEGGDFWRTDKAQALVEDLCKYALFFMPGGETWRKHRKVLSAGFAPAHLKHALEASNACCEVVFGIWRKQLAEAKAGITTDLYGLFNAMALDVLSAMAFSYDYKATENHLNPESLIELASFQRMFEVFVQRISAPRFLWSLIGIAPHQMAVHVETVKRAVRKAVENKKQTLRDLIARNAQERAAAGPDKEATSTGSFEEATDEDDEGWEHVLPSTASLEGLTRLDILDRLLLTTDWTEQELVDEMIALFLAGHDTTANLLTSAMLMIHTHPTVLDRVRAEARALGLTPSTPVTWAHLPKLRYLDAVIKETLRLYPSVIGSSGREVVSDTLTLLGHPVARGTVVQVDYYSLHRDPRYWSHPLAFDPDRWLDDTKPPHPPGAYLPFSSGAHMCLGNRMAVVEAKCLLARLCVAFEFEVVPGQDLEPLTTVTHGLKNGLKMGVKERRV
ncbi:hypothetical protein HDU96_001480 [Phlyctochytrium bullatum]|nr:hypothetical protein HDU96_001480 [Phlyctochytrium bullatum]